MSCGCGSFFTRKQSTVIPLRVRDDTTAVVSDDKVEPAEPEMTNPEEVRGQITPRRVENFKNFQKEKSQKSIELGQKRLVHNASKSVNTKTTPHAQPSNLSSTAHVQQLRLGVNSPLASSAPSPTLSAASTHRSHAEAKNSANSPANLPMQILPGIVPSGP